MSAAPDLDPIRSAFDRQKRRILESGDADSIQQLAELERRADDPSYWANAPSVVDQLADHLKRLGIT